MICIVRVYADLPEVFRAARTKAIGDCLLVALGGGGAIPMKVDANRHFEFLNVPPGDYRLYAWSDMEEVEYDNASYLAALKERQNEQGKPLTVETNSQIAVDELKSIAGR